MDGTPCDGADPEKDYVSNQGYLCEDYVSIQTCYSVRIVLAVHAMNYSL